MTKKHDNIRHVHIGAGALGLGFVVPLVQQAGHKTILANRAHGTAAHHARNVTLQRQRSYDLVLASKQPRTEDISIAEFIFIDEDSERFFEIVADPAIRLLTTALRQGLLPSVPLLADALAHRLTTGTREILYIVACETPTIGDSLSLRAAILAERPELMTRAFDQRIQFVSCIVDRICNEPVVREDTGRVSVDVEEFAEWLLQGPSLLEAILVTDDTKDFTSFVSDLVPFRPSQDVASERAAFTHCVAWVYATHRPIRCIPRDKREQKTLSHDRARGTSCVP